MNDKEIAKWLQLCWHEPKDLEFQEPDGIWYVEHYCKYCDEKMFLNSDGSLYDPLNPNFSEYPGMMVALNVLRDKEFIVVIIQELQFVLCTINRLKQKKDSLPYQAQTLPLVVRGAIVKIIEEENNVV